MSQPPTLTLCKMCARLADYRSGAGVWLCNECRDYLLRMADDKTDIGLRITHGLSIEVPPWELVERRRAQEFIEAELAEPIP